MRSVDDAVRRLQSAFGKRHILREHRTAAPAEAPADRVRYLTALAAINAEFIAQVSVITVPPSARSLLRELTEAVEVASRPMRSFVEQASRNFDEVAARLGSMEQAIVGAFLDLIAALEPTSVARAIRRDRDVDPA